MSIKGKKVSKEYDLKMIENNNNNNNNNTAHVICLEI